jgi:hypothetical protein
MRVLEDISKYPADPAQRFFVQAWYSMVHRDSLDSHRVRSMDALNILREVQGLLGKRHIQSIQKDIRRAAEEASDIIHGDPLLAKQFPLHVRRVEPLLAKAASDDKGQPSAALSYYI